MMMACKDTDADKSPTSHDYDGHSIMDIQHHQFFTNEVRPVRFGPSQDAWTTLIITFSMVIFFHLLLYLLHLIHPTIIDGSPLWKLYTSSPQFLIGGLLYLWIAGYNLVSWVIWRQFERSEAYGANDFYIAREERERGQPSEPILLHLPNGNLALGLAMEEDPSAVWRNDNFD